MDSRYPLALTSLAAALLLAGCKEPPRREVASEPARPVVAAPRAPAKPMAVGGEVDAPVAIQRVDPDFEACKGVRGSGGVVIDAVISADGIVQDARIVRPVHPCIDEAVLSSIRQWRFKPATYRGKPVAVTYVLVTNIHWR
jgi:TonB family protein